MGLYFFCMITLSAVFLLIFGIWWDGTAPFHVQLSSLIVASITLASIFLAIFILPKVKHRSASVPPKSGRLDSIGWSSDISSKLSSPVAVVDGYKIVFANNIFLSELGMSSMNELITDMPITNLVHPSDHGTLTKFLTEPTKDGPLGEVITLRMFYADGTTIPVHMSVTPLNQDAYSHLNLLQFSTLSSRKPVSSTDSDQFDYRLILDRIEEIVFQINVAQSLIYVNPSWQRLLDYTAAESINRALISFVHPEDGPLVEARLNSLTQGKRHNCNFEVRLIAKNGASQWVQLRASATTSRKSERSSVIGTLTDISQRKQTEAALKESRHSPVESVLSNMPCMVYRCKNDRNWTFEFVSDGCHAVTEYQPYELVNSPNLNYVHLAHPDDQLQAWGHVQQQVIEQRKFQLIYRIITRSGKVKWIMEQGKGIFSSTDELLTVEGLIIDISDNRHSELLSGLQKLLVSQQQA